MTATGRRSLAAVVALLAVLAQVVAAAPARAHAPKPSPSAEAETPLLGDVLAATGKQYLQAKAVLDKSRKNQLELAVRLKRAEERLAALTPQVAQFAAEAYRTGRLTPTAALLNSRDPDVFLERALALEQMNEMNDQRMRQLEEAREQAASAKLAMDAEVARAAQAQAAMARQKREAEKALALVGGMKLTGGFVVAESPKARPAPRTRDGGWPNESCSENDPTTGGCLTPRTLHAYKEVKRAKFDRFVGCFRSGGPYEHPKGRACDWSLRKSGFATASTKDEKLYGNNLAAFLIRNADALGVLYVIWYRQIWLPATGWRAYHGASAHTDHVHMSML